MRVARNESRDIINKCIEISQIFNNIIEMYQRCNHKHIYTVIHDFYYSNKCTETVKIQSEDSLEWWQLISEKRCDGYSHL
jgi:hypothetical protein